MENQASITALMAAFTRAYHAQTAKYPVFNDTFAKKLMTDGEYEQIKKHIISGADFFATEKKYRESEESTLAWIVNTQLAPTPIARARYCEDSLKAAVKTGTTQYVILGAGLDTYALREQGITVFEVDHPKTQEDKKLRLANANVDIPKCLHFVPVDFRKDNLKEALYKSGFDETQKTFFSLLGVSYYLSDEEFENIIESISSFAADGSTLLFDYPDENLFTAQEKRVQNMLAMAAAGGEPMKFCSDELELTLLLDKYNFLIYELLTPADIDAKFYFGRSDGLSAFEHVNYALAVIKGAQHINTKEKIMQTALSLFAQKGYDAVSVKDISDSLFISKGALYRHFISKRDIFDSVISRMEETAKAENVCVQNQISLNDIENYILNQFDYWTKNSFASRFRKMLTIEQYGDKKAAALYKKYIISNPVERIKAMLCSMGKTDENAELLAFEIYSTVFLMYGMYDAQGDDFDVASAIAKHIKHITRLSD